MGKGGSVNRYKDNGDGGHSHEYCRVIYDYNGGEDPDNSIYENNDSPNADVLLNMGTGVVENLKLTKKL